MISKKISSGADVVDNLLDGGYECDAITTIYGPAGVGKTNLAILAAVKVAESGKKVIYIDTEGGFSITRLKQIITNPKKTLGNIIFLKPTNFEEQKKCFEKLKNLVNKNIGLIIVDTISMLYRFERKSGEAGFDFSHDLAMQVSYLSEITRRKNIPVLINNQVYTSFDDNSIKMIGGEILKYGSKCLLEIQPLNNNKRKILIRKHRSIAGEKQVIFEIINEGIREVR